MPALSFAHSRIARVVTGSWMAILLLGSGSALAEDGQTNVSKSSYTLFNPTPTNLMRDMNTDRPNKTDSPFTVDAGHCQLESDIVNHTSYRDRTGGGCKLDDATSFATLNTRFGLCNWSEFQLISSPHNTLRINDQMAHTTTTRSGFGDLFLRLKANLWGDDGGVTALGIIPTMKLPTSQDNLGNHGVEEGVSVPLAVNLPHNSCSAPWRRITSAATLTRSTVTTNFRPA